MSAEEAAKALTLYERRVFSITTDATKQPNSPSILGAYGRLIVLRDECAHQHPWITCAIDAVHSELVHILIDATNDASVEVVLGNDPVLRYEAELATNALKVDEDGMAEEA